VNSKDVIDVCSWGVAVMRVSDEADGGQEKVLWAVVCRRVGSAHWS